MKKTMEINCPSYLKEYLVDEVINKSKKYPELNELSKNYSYEGGFELPWNDEWLNADFYNCRLAFKYHNTRQLRFVESNNIIIGLRFKDDCDYWSTCELGLLKNLIESVLCE